ncbi:hypothetical protein ACFYOT_17600 [Saccharothrix saharensis]|uniref:hypothetical protein n=1 Tax=Saccharothrix saharensis TaxID=571190 RepID=UPI003697E5DA
MFQPYLAEYHYYALFKDGYGMADIRNGQGLYRSVTVHDEERYEGHGRWTHSGDLSRARERDSDDDYREVTPAEVEQLRRRIDAERPEEPLPSSSREERRDGGGFAVFRHPADVVDPRSAVAVVDELSPDHRYTVPLTRVQRERLAGTLALLAARRRAEPVDGHHHFAEFDSLDDVVDVDRAHALVRCPADGQGNWELFLHDRTWVRGREPWRKHVLPVGREDLERIRRGRETAEVRYFDVWQGHSADGGHRLHDLVRRTGSTDEIVDDLGWQPTDLLRRLEPDWWVRELGELGFRSSRYVAVMMGRSRRFGDRADDYQAVFRKGDDLHDLGDCLFLAKRSPNPYELEYEL